jgi:hypothetical protein
VRAVGERYRREAGALLYDFAVGGYENDCDDAPLEMSSELRARDLDADGEVEVTVIAAVAAIPLRGRHYNPRQECGVVAFLIGANDLEIQARVSRRHHIAQLDAGGYLFSLSNTTWRLEDLNGDGHADLRITEAYRYTFDFQGDYIGGGETAPAEHERRANRRSVDCIYDAASDRWPCPLTTPPIGQTLFRDRNVLVTEPRSPIPEW